MIIVSWIHKISDMVNRICGVLCIAMLTAMVVITGMQIICRVFFTALIWSEEATRYLLVWSTFIGGSIVYKNAGHISVTLLQEMFPKAAKMILKIAVHLICGVLCAVAVYFGFNYIVMQGNQLSAAMRIPMRFIYLSVPVGFAITELHIIDAVIQILIIREEAQA